MDNNSVLKNILFDVGGVIIDLDVNATLEAFYNLGFPPELLRYPENFHTDIFQKYETGQLSTNEFRDEIRKLTGLNFSDESFDRAWCAMLVDVPSERIKLIQRLADRYDLYILSNTSDLHIPLFEEFFRNNGGVSMNDLFKKCFYSSQIGFHKPDISAFRVVLETAGIKAEQTLFLDDNLHNIKAAKELGFNAIHISEYRQLSQLGFDL